jgi:hypothetical protein
MKVQGTNLRAPTDIAALTAGRLIIADEGRLVMLAPNGDGYRVAGEFRWGETERKRLGKRLHFAVDGSWMLLSDTERHRVLWLDWVEWRVLAVWGKTGKVGDELWYLHSPTFVALRGTKALVANSGKQRVPKLQLTP